MCCHLPGDVPCVSDSLLELSYTEAQLSSASSSESGLSMLLSMFANGRGLSCTRQPFKGSAGSAPCPTGNEKDCVSVRHLREHMSGI